MDEKLRIQETTNNTTKRLSGYINREEYLMRQSTSSSSCINDNNDRKPLTNSSSKSNVGSSVLRENHDSKSAQKQTSNISFSGRNQKNLSPYNDKSRTSTNLNKQNKLLIGNTVNSLHSNIMKVKRQISFDN